MSQEWQNGTRRGEFVRFCMIRDKSGFNGSVQTWGGRRAAAAREDGAAVVEFALVSTLLFLIMFGVLQYGLYFNDALSTRQGVREGARQGVVRNFTAQPGCTSETTDMDRLRCNTRKQIDALTGTEYVKV